jgi:hypothetical protein
MKVLVALGLIWAWGIAFVLAWQLEIARRDPETVARIFGRSKPCLIAIFWPLVLAWLVAILLYEAAAEGTRLMRRSR